METTIATTKKKSIKKMIFLVLSLLTAVSMFMSCDPMDPDMDGIRLHQMSISIDNNNIQ